MATLSALISFGAGFRADGFETLQPVLGNPGLITGQPGDPRTNGLTLKTRS